MKWITLILWPLGFITLLLGIAHVIPTETSNGIAMLLWAWPAGSAFGQSIMEAIYE